MLSNLFRKSALFASLLLINNLSLAQSPMLQAGPWAPGHVPMYIGQGSGSPAMLDSGPAGGGQFGVGLTELGLTIQGQGTPPFANSGTGEFNTNLCDRDGPITGPYHFLCLSPNAQGGGLIAYGAAGGATPLPLNISINGTLANLGAILPTATTSQLYGGSGVSGVANVVSLGTGLTLAGETLSVTSIPPGSIPTPTPSTLGGLFSASATTHKWVTNIDTTGTQQQSQPACGDLSNSGTACQSNTGTSGATLGLLNSNKTDSGNNTFSGTDNFTGTLQLNGVAVGTASNYNIGTTGATVPLNNGGFTQSGLANFTGGIQVNGQAIVPTTSFATIAALRLNSASSIVTAFITGYYSLADGGEGVFILNPSDTTSSDNGGTIIVDAGSHRWYREDYGSPKVNVKQFGAKGLGSSHDDTTAIQAAITYAKSTFTSNGIAATVYFPTPVSAYYVTSPLNATVSTIQYGLRFQGDGTRNTILEGELSSGGPIIDMTGMAASQIVDMTITSTAPGSLATAGVLWASASGNTGNYNNLMDRSQVIMTNNSVICGVALQNSDLFTFDHSYSSVNNSSSNAGISFCGGGAIESGITSPFQTIGSTVDQTDYRLNNSWLTGNLAVDFTGGAGLTFVNTYAAVIGTANSDNAIIRINASGTATNINVRAFNLRTENQATANKTAINAIYSKSNSPLYRLQLTGLSQINIDPAAGGPSTGSYVKLDNASAASDPITLDLDFFTVSGSHPLFNAVAGNVVTVSGKANVNTAPAMAGGATVSNWTWISTFTNQINFSTFFAAHLLGQAQIGNMPGWTTGATVQMDARVKYMLGVTGQVSPLTGYNYTLWWSHPNNYVGGSGTQISETFTVPAGMLVGETVIGNSTRKWNGHFHAKTTAASTTVGIQIRQGANTYVLGTTVITSTSDIDAQIVVDNLSSGSGLYLSGLMTVGLAPAINANTSSAYGVIDPTQDFYVDFTVNSASNTPFNTTTRSVWVN